MPSNKTLKYNKTLDEVNVNDDLSVSIKISDMRKAAEVHRQVRRYIQPLIKPKVKYLDICEKIEAKTIELFGKNDLTKGIGFPTGFSVNNICAHDSANPYDKRRIKYNDVIKIDYGTQMNGNIIDSAFTVAFNPKYDNLLEATKDATWTGIKLAGPDMLLQEISKEIKEIIESYEVELNNRTYKVKSVVNLGGHNILPYKIHGGKLILCGPNKTINQNWRMNVGECYAIETFGSVGEKSSNMITYNNELPINHFMLKNTDNNNNLSVTANKLFNHIKKTRATLPFCTRWIKHFKNYKNDLLELGRNNLINGFPPLVDNKNTYSSQLEHTIYLHDYGKEILSYGDDY